MVLLMNITPVLQTAEIFILFNAALGPVLKSNFQSEMKKQTPMVFVHDTMDNIVSKYS